MAITVRVELLDGYPQNVGAKFEAIARLHLTGTYVQGGFDLEAAPFGMKYIEYISGSVEQNSYQEFANWQPDAGVPFEFAHYLILQNVSNGSEVTNGQDLTGDICIIHVRGF